MLLALLRAIGEKRIAAIPQNLRILLMGQTTGDGDGGDMHAGEETVLQHVVRSDREREKAVREAGSECSPSGVRDELRRWWR